MLKQIASWIPNALTLTSVFLGFSSILFSVQAINDLYLSVLQFSTPVPAYPEYFLALSGLSIFFASILDFLDGFAARLLNASSPIGKQLDSLADFISFGVAPAVLFFTVTLIATEHIPEAGIGYSLPQTGWFNWTQGSIIFFKIIAFVVPACTIFRLARFNLITERQSYFEGLPSTYSGGVLAIMLTFNFYLTPIGRLLKQAELPAFFLQFVNLFQEIFSNYFFLTTLYIIFAGLMVSRIRFYKLDYLFAQFKLRRPITLTIVLLGIATAIISVFLFKYAYIIVCLGYVFISILVAGIKRILGRT